MKLRLLTVPLMAALGIVSAYGSPCTAYTYSVGVSPHPSACTVDGGNVTLFADELTISQNFFPGQQINISYTDTPTLVGVTFTFMPLLGATHTQQYTVGYTATATGGANFINVDDSGDPNHNSYAFYGDGFICANYTNHCNKQISTYVYPPPVTSAANYGVFYPTLENYASSITLDYGIGGPVGSDQPLSLPSSATPEPTTMLLFGTGFMGLGLIKFINKSK